MNLEQISLPIRAKPFEHQIQAFAFAMRIFGVFQEEGGTDCRIHGFGKKKGGDANDSNQ